MTGPETRMLAALVSESPDLGDERAVAGPETRMLAALVSESPDLGDERAVAGVETGRCGPDPGLNPS